MADARAIAGTYADLKFIRTRSVAQIVVEIPIEEAGRFVAMFGTPTPSGEIPVALARLNESVGRLEDEPPNAVMPKKDKRRFAEKSAAEQSGIRCADESFREYLGVLGYAVVTEEDAARCVRYLCGVPSRANINEENVVALERWQTLEKRYQDWLADRQYKDSVR